METDQQWNHNILKKVKNKIKEVKMSSTRKSNPKHSSREILNQLNRLLKGNETGHYLSDDEKDRIKSNVEFYTMLDKKFGFYVKEMNK